MDHACGAVGDPGRAADAFDAERALRIRVLRIRRDLGDAPALECQQRSTADGTLPASAGEDSVSGRAACLHFFFVGSNSEALIDGQRAIARPIGRYCALPFNTTGACRARARPGT